MKTHNMGILYECPACMMIVNRKDIYLRHYRTIHPFNLVEGSPPPPVIVTRNEDLQKQPRKKQKTNSTAKYTPTPIPPTDPRLDPTIRSKFANKSKPHCPGYLKVLKYDDKFSPKASAVAPRTEDSEPNQMITLKPKNDNIPTLPETTPSNTIDPIVKPVNLPPY